MSLSTDQQDEIRPAVWSGIHSRNQLVAIVTEELYAPGDIDADDATAFIDAELARKSVAEAAWPAETDCDRLTTVFARLNASGLAAVENAGLTMSDGFEDVDALCAARGGPGSQCFGYCFFHGQDLAHAQDGDGLHLAFGAFSGDGPKTVAVGQLVADTAAEHGLQVSWDGTPGQRILLVPFTWRKRGVPRDA